jgi:signal transduction histidine kinase
MINQPWPLSTNSDACLRWLNGDEPDLDEGRDAVSSITRVRPRAAAVTKTFVLWQENPSPTRDFDINSAIQEILALSRNELTRHDIVVRTDLAAGGRTVVADRVQMQQVVLNLVMNGSEAMSAVMDRPKVLMISSEHDESGGVRVAVKDTGAGIDPGIADRIFESLFTTKPNGMGMGLSICRSIIEAHGGRFWTSPNTPHGAIFQFTIPGDGREPVAPKQTPAAA